MNMPCSARLQPLGRLVLAAAALLTATAAHAQFAGPQQEQTTTPVHDTSALHPPPGARVAIVEFEDLECPDCARVNPVLKQATEQYHIPWVRHDFPLPQHDWSFQAAVNARWFDTKSKKLGDEYRDTVFAHQNEITVIENGAPNGDKALANLRDFTQKFAASHSVGLPFVMDPQKKLASEVKADYALGQRIGIEHTPTFWVVTNSTKGVPFVEVVDRSRLYSMIEGALADTKDSTAPTTKRVAAKH
jgi:protein-disulfide isomerase